MASNYKKEPIFVLEHVGRFNKTPREVKIPGQKEWSESGDLH